MAIERKGEKYYYHADGLGSITALSDSKQKTMESYSYSSFGEIKQQGSKVKNTYTFTGREWDEEIDLYYYRARYYDADVGRFISKDPIGFIGGTNLYVYVQNNPIRFIDPFGLLTFEEIKTLAAANNLSGQSNEMIICMCWKESNFDPKAQSSISTARGLMQVTKGAAKDTGYNYDLLFDPATNIQAGSKYLKLAIQRVPSVSI